MKPIKLLLLAVTGIVIFIFFIDKRKEKINKMALEDLNLKLTAVVTNIDEMAGINNLGIITAHILHTNVTAYDPRDSIEFYYCVIKDSTIEIYDHAVKKMIGDTINIDTKRKLQCRGSEWNEKTTTPIELNTNKNYYDYIKRTTRFKR